MVTMLLAYIQFRRGHIHVEFVIERMPERVQRILGLFNMLLALGFLGPILARMAYLLALRRMELSKVAVVSQSQPVYVIMISFLVLSQLPTFREIVGGLFLIGGCLLMIVSHRPRHKPTG